MDDSNAFGKTSGADVGDSSNPQPIRQPQPATVDVDDSEAVACYANFCRITGTPEELLIDFGLNPQPVGNPTQPIQVSQRIITNLYTAKRLQQVLQLTIQRHEATFGVLETDVQRRVIGSGGQG